MGGQSYQISPIHLLGNEALLLPLFSMGNNFAVYVVSDESLKSPMAIPIIGMRRIRVPGRIRERNP